MNSDKYSTSRRKNSWSLSPVLKLNGARFPESHTTWPIEVAAPAKYIFEFLPWLTYLNSQQFIPLDRIDQMSCYLERLLVKNSPLFNQDVKEQLHRNLCNSDES